MRCFLFIPYEREVYTPDGGYDTAWETYYHIINCRSKKMALKYLRRNIVVGDVKKYNNLSDYIKNCVIRCLPEKYKKIIKENFNVEKEYSK